MNSLLNQKETPHKINTAGASALLAAASFVGAATLPAAEAEGIEMRSVVDKYAQHQSLAMNPAYGGPVAVGRIDAANGLTYASGFQIAPDIFLTAGHVTPRNDSLTASIVEVVFGPNYNTSTARYTVDRTERFPGYIFGDTTTIDAGLIFTNDFVPMARPATFADGSIGEWHTIVGYGNFGDASTGELPSLGDKLAGVAPVFNIKAGVSPYPSNLYSHMLFDVNPSGLLDAKGLPRDSGSAWYNFAGDYTFMTVAGTNGFGGGVTTALKLNNPDFQAYLQPFIIDSWARFEAAQEPGGGGPGGNPGNGSLPEPATAVLGVLGVAALLGRRR